MLYFIYGALRNLVPFVQSKKCEKHPWRSVTKINTPPWVFFTFLNCTNGTKSRNAPHLPNRKYTRNAEKHEQVAIKYLKAKILNDAKQQFSSSDQGDKINAASVKSLREKKYYRETSMRNMFFYAKKWKKKYFI